jgi:hypothetical protein
MRRAIANTVPVEWFRAILAFALGNVVLLILYGRLDAVGLGFFGLHP